MKQDIIKIRKKVQIEERKKSENKIKSFYSEYLSGIEANKLMDKCHNNLEDSAPTKILHLIPELIKFSDLKISTDIDKLFFLITLIESVAYQIK